MGKRGGRMERRDEKEREESLKEQNKAWLFGLILEGWPGAATAGHRHSNREGKSDGRGLEGRIKGQVWEERRCRNMGGMKQREKREDNEVKDTDFRRM